MTAIQLSSCRHVRQATHSRPLSTSAFTHCRLYEEYIGDLKSTLVRPARIRLTREVCLHFHEETSRPLCLRTSLPGAAPQNCPCKWVGRFAFQMHSMSLAAACVLLLLLSICSSTEVRLCIVQLPLLALPDPRPLTLTSDLADVAVTRRVARVCSAFYPAVACSCETCADAPAKPLLLAATCVRPSVPPLWSAS